MSGNYEPTQARNTIFKVKWCEGKFLANLVTKWQQGFFYSSSDLKSHNKY